MLWGLRNHTLVGFLIISKIKVAGLQVNLKMGKCMVSGLTGERMAKLIGKSRIY